MPVLASTLRLSPPVDIEARVRDILDSGYLGIGLEAPLHSFQWEEAWRTAGRGVFQSVRLFLPYPRGLTPGAECPFRLGSLHPEEKQDALKYGSETITFAERHSIPFVLLPPAARGGDSRAALSSFLSTLSRLLDLAARYAVRLAIEPAIEAARLPGWEEVETCLKEFAGAPLELWPRAEGEEHAAWERFAGRLAGVTVPLPGDIVAAAGLAAPAVEVAVSKPFRPLLDASPIWLLDFPPGTALDGLRAGREGLEALVRGPEKDPFV